MLKTEATEYSHIEYKIGVGKLFDRWGHKGLHNVMEGPQQQMDGVFVGYEESMCVDVN